MTRRTPMSRAEARNERAVNLRREILVLVREYHDVAFQAEPFVPAETSLRYAGRVSSSRAAGELGSSANLVAFSALTLPELGKKGSPDVSVGR